MFVRTRGLNVRSDLSKTREINYVDILMVLICEEREIRMCVGQVQSYDLIAPCNGALSNLTRDEANRLRFIADPILGAGSTKLHCHTVTLAQTYISM